MDLQKYLHLDDIVDSNNIVELMHRDDAENVGQTVLRHFTEDKQSRAEWEERQAEAMKLVMQLVEEKSFPWPGASNAKFPLLTIAALQYHARAYPALVRGTRPVNCRVIGEDLDGKKTARAKRVSEHMSFQVMEEDEAWEEGFDKALIVQSILGCVFRKAYYDSSKGCNVTDTVLPKDLVINYWAKSLDTVSRLTHVIGLTPEELEERTRRGLYVRPASTEGDGAQAVRSMPAQDSLTAAQDDIGGVMRPAIDEDAPTIILEHHFWLDLDGDGYREPYIAFVRQDTGEMLRLVARFEKDKVEYAEDGMVVKITPEKFFTKLPFIPSPDGSIYDMGFEMLLGATNHVINSLINQLMDAGTMSNLKCGFLARGVRVRGGDYSFKPHEWKRTDSSAEDLAKGIYPMPTGEPSPVLFQLLTMMIDYGQRIGMATDAATGQNPGQNQKVGTTQAVIEQGEKVFNGIYKRTYRALRNEFRLHYRLNYLRKPASGKFSYASDEGQGGFALWTDYLDTDKSVVPAADPSIASRELLLERAMHVREMAGTVPGYNRWEVDRRILDLLEVPAIDAILPKPGSEGAPPPPMPAPVMVAQIKSQIEQAKIQAADRRHQLELMEQARLNQATIMKLEAEAALIMEQAGIAKNEKLTSLIDTELSAAKQYQDQLTSTIGAYGKLFEQMNQPQGDQGGKQTNQPAGVGSVAQPGGNPGVPGVPAR